MQKYDILPPFFQRTHWEHLVHNTRVRAKFRERRVSDAGKLLNKICICKTMRVAFAVC